MKTWILVIFTGLFFLLSISDSVAQIRNKQVRVNLRELNPTLPSEYFSNIGLQAIIPIEKSNTKVVTFLNGDILFNEKNRLDIETGFIVYEGNKDTRFSDLSLLYRGLVYKDHKKASGFISAEINGGLVLPIGKLGLDGNENTMAFQLGSQFGLKVNDILFFYPKLEYAHIISIKEGYDVSSYLYTFGTTIPVVLNKTFFFHFSPMYYYQVTDYTNSYTGESTREIDHFYLLASFNAVLGKNVLSLNYQSHNEFDYNYLGFSFYIYYN
jgi:hypothetical protein